MVKINSSISSSEKLAFRRLSIRLLMFLPIPVVIIAINYFIDPANLYWGARKYNCIASAIASGMNVRDVDNLDERLVQEKIITKIKAPPRQLIIGSSRSMMIGDNIFQQKSLNNSVSGASLEDYLALWYVYDEKGFLPEVFVIGLDPWILNRNSGQGRWQSLNNNYQKMIKRLNLKAATNASTVSEKTLNLISLSYFQTSTTDFKKQFQKRWKESTDLCVATSELQSKEKQMILWDGRRVYDEKMRLRTVTKVEEDAISYGTDKNVYSLSGFAELDKENLKTLEVFSKYLLLKGVKVVFYLPPYHPTTFKKIIARDDTKIILEVEKAYKELGQRLHIPVVGSSNPDSYKLMGDVFFDGMHAKEKGAQAVFKAHKEELKEANVLTIL